MAGPLLAPPMAGFWSRIEAWLLDLQADRPRLARYIQVAYWISNAVILVGIVVAFLVLTGTWSP